jgi:hypothetical protein
MEIEVSVGSGFKPMSLKVASYLTQTSVDRLPIALLNFTSPTIIDSCRSYIESMSSNPMFAATVTADHSSCKILAVIQNYYSASTDKVR